MENLAFEKVKLFSETGKRFCDLIDVVNSLSSRQFIHELALVLTALYSAAMELPDVDAEGEIEQDPNTQDLWSKVHEQVGNKLGQFNFYWENFDPHKETELVATTIGDDIADIYCDIKPGLVCWEKTNQKQLDVAWKWKFSFYAHRGNHLVDTLRALHRVTTHYYEIDTGME